MQIHSQRSIFARPCQRKGTFIFAVIVCVLVITTVAISTISLSVRYRRQMRKDVAVDQACWILDGAVRLAIDKFQNDPDYLGESIRVETELPSFKYGFVDIAVTPKADSEDVKIRVVTRLSRVSEPVSAETTDPVGSIHSIKRSAEVVLPRNKIKMIKKEDS
ncbi:MAG: hypothetical protein AAGA30_00100 [Planctomycetota bacterium]